MFSKINIIETFRQGRKALKPVEAYIDRMWKNPVPEDIEKRRKIAQELLLFAGGQTDLSKRAQTCACVLRYATPEITEENQNAVDLLLHTAVKFDDPRLIAMHMKVALNNSTGRQQERAWSGFLNAIEKQPMDIRIGELQLLADTTYDKNVREKAMAAVKPLLFKNSSFSPQVFNNA